MKPETCVVRIAFSSRCAFAYELTQPASNPHQKFAVDVKSYAPAVRSSMKLTQPASNPHQKFAADFKNYTPTVRSSMKRTQPF